MAPHLKSITERFWSKVDIKDPDECWNWKASKLNGYGAFTRENRRFVSSHRMSYELSYGVIPIGLQVLHKCNNKLCVNPEHLKLGTHSDNMIDAIKDGLCIKWNYIRRKSK